MSFVSPPLPPPPSEETRFYCFAVTSPTPRSSGETGYESPRQNKASWGCCSGFALRVPWKCTIFCFRLTHCWINPNVTFLQLVSICQLLQNALSGMLLNVGKDQKTNKNIHNKELCSAGILKIIKQYCFFFLRCARGAKGNIKFKISQPWNTLWILSQIFYLFLKCSPITK